MRQPRTAADEPAGTYSLHTVTRSVLTMTERPLHDYSIAEAGKLLRERQGHLGGTDRACVRTHRGDRSALINSFILVTTRAARWPRRQTADADFAKGIDKGPMQGIPLCAEGHLRHRRHPHDLPFQAAASTVCRRRIPSSPQKFKAQGGGDARQARDA